jgi:hypothetical protein
VVLLCCVIIRTAERPSREWAYFGGLLFGNYVILWGVKVLKKRAALALSVVIRSHFLSFIYSNETEYEKNELKVFRLKNVPSHRE